MLPRHSRQKVQKYSRQEAFLDRKSGKSINGLACWMKDILYTAVFLSTSCVKSLRTIIVVLLVQSAVAIKHHVWGG